MPARFFSDLGFVLLFWAVLGGGSLAFLRLQPGIVPAPAKGGGRAEAWEEVDFAWMQGADRTGAVVIDARSRDQYRAGHIPGAISWPRSEEAVVPASVLAGPRDRPLIVYCTGVECEDAAIVARRLRARGFSRPGIYRGGWEEWTENGGEVER